jgi:hypothetical protein
MNEGDIVHDKDIDPDDFVDDFYNDIVTHRVIPRGTNWIYCFTSLSQLEVALATNITSSVSSYTHVSAAIIVTTVQFIVTTVQLLQAICINQCHHNAKNSQLSHLELRLL